MQKRSKRLLAVILAVCMMMTLLPMTAFAEENVNESPDTYTDVSLDDAKAYLSGSGTKADPFQIWTADDLYYINYIEYWHWKDNDPSKSSNVYYYQQKADLDLSKADTNKFDKPHGYITANFGGVYDGGGHTISGMDKPLFYFTKGTYVGDKSGAVFSNYSSHEAVFSAIVRNLTIEEPNIEQTVATDVIEQIAAVAAYAVNTTFYNIKVSGGSVSGISGAAAIVGRGSCVVIDSCSSDADISSSLYRASGIVSNLRIVDEPKGATSTSLVTKCTFSGNISGPLDGARGSAGIVGGVYAEYDEDQPKWPFYLTNCTFSGTIDTTVTSGTGNVGGILGVSFLSDGLVITGNTSTGKITAATSGTGSIANVGGIVGTVGTYVTMDLDNNISNNTGNANLPTSNYEKNIYVGKQVGCINSQSWEFSENISVSENSTSNGLYGMVQKATLTGNVGDVVIPSSSNAATLYIEEGAEVGSITSGCTSTLTIYNEGKVGDVTNTGSVTINTNTGTIDDITSENGAITVGANNNAETPGNAGTLGDLTANTAVNIYRNAEGGTIGDVTSKTGAINVGANNKSESDNGGATGNAGTLGSLTASTAVTVCRNTGEIGDVKSETSSVTIGQNNTDYAVYNTNEGTIGSVNAATTVSIYAGSASGKVAADTNESITAGTSVTIGSTNVVNQNTVGPVNAGTSVNIYGGESGIVGDVTADTTVTIGSTAVPNQSEIGTVKAKTSVAIYGGDKGSVAAGEGESVTAGTTVTIGSATVLNKSDIGAVNASGNITVYADTGATIGDITRTGETAANVTVGSTTAPNKANVGNISNVSGTVTGYTVGTVGTVNAKTNSLLTAGSAGEGIDVITASGTITISADENGKITVNETEYASISKLVLTAASTVTFSGDNTVKLSAIQASGSLTLLDASGKAEIDAITGTGSVALGNNTVLFKGTVGNITANSTVTVGNSTANYYFQGTVTGNITGTSVNIYNNSGTIGSEDQDENRTTITATTGNISVTNQTGATISSNIVNNSATGTTSVNNQGNAMSGDITSNSTGVMTLYGNAKNTDNTAKFTGTITVNGNLTIGSSIGPNNEGGAVEVTLKDGATITNNVNCYYYLKVSGDNINSLTVLTTTAAESGAYRNTIDLSSLDEGISVTRTVGAGTELKLPQGAGEPATLGTQVTVASNVVNNASEVANVDAYFTGSVMIVGSESDGNSVKICEGQTLTLTSTSSIYIYNYGTIGNIVHTGTGTLYIYNMVENAKIGTVTSKGAVAVEVNKGEIGDITAASAVNIGKNNVTESSSITGTHISPTCSPCGNEGKLGNLTSTNSTVTVYRNAEGGTIGAVTSKTASVTIGQNNTTYKDYNTNAGTIGSVNAKTSVAIYANSTEGKVATGKDESVTAGTTVTIGYINGATTVVNGNTIGTVKAGTDVKIYGGKGGKVAASEGESVTAGATVTIGYTSGSTTVVNQSEIGTVNAGTSVSIYNGAAKIGNVTSESGVTVSANGEGGTIGDITSETGGINVGVNNKDADTNGVATGNAGKLGNLTASTAVNIYRNTGTIGDVESKTSSVAIGQNSTDANITAYNTNAGTIGSVTAATGVSIYASSKDGSVAADAAKNEKVTAGTSVNIGSTNVANGNKIGPVEAATGVSIYNGENGEIATKEGNTVTSTGGNISIKANQGTVGDVKAASGSITVGENNKSESNANGSIGNAGTLGNLTANGAVSIYRNTENATIDNVKSETSSVTVGNYSADTTIAAYNANAGTIGGIEAGTDVKIYNNKTNGMIAADEGKTVTAKTGITVGYVNAPNNTYMQNQGKIGPMTTQSGIVTVSNAGTIGTITNEGTSNNTLYIYNGATSTSLAAGGGAVTINDKTESKAPNVNSTTDGGSVTVNPNTEANVSVHVTVTNALGKDETMTIRGGFATVIHNGEGSVVMETANTSVTNIVEKSSGKVLQFGETGAVITPSDNDTATYTLSLVQTGPNTVDVYLLSVDGTPLAASTQVTDLKVTTENGTVTPASDTVNGGGASEKIGTVTLTGSGEVTVSGTYQDKTITATLNAKIPALIDRVDTVLLTSEKDFEAAKETYGWDEDSVTDPVNYPVLAVMPVINEAYENESVTVTVKNETVTGIVSFVPVDLEGKAAGDKLSVSVSANTLDASVSYSDDATYTLTAADLAKLDSENTYYYVTYRYMDGTTADKVVPVEQSKSLTLEAPNSRTGYTFLGWSDGTDTYTANATYAPEANATLTAQWGADQVTHTLTLSVSGSGKVVNGTTGAEITSGTSFLEGTEITLRAEPYAGHYFRSWSVGGTTSSESTVTITISGDVTVNANFGRNSTSSGGSAYSVSTGSAEHGSIAVSPKNAAKDKTVTITATPDEGYELASLTVTDAKGNAISLTEQGGGKYTFTMPASGVTVLAAFREIPQIHVCPSEPYTDVDTSLWYHAAIDYAIEKGMMNGVGLGEFAPNGLLSRGMMVTILYRLEGKPAVSGAPFADVGSGLWYTDAVAWAAANGIVDGYGNGNFGPEDNITREQMAAILYRYASFKGYDMSARGNLSSFTDGSQTSAWAREAMQWAVGTGLINGKGNATLDPLGTAQRSEVAQILMNFCENIAEQ